MRLKFSLIIGLVFWLLFSSFINRNGIKVLDFDEFEPYLFKNNDTTYIINFWATWCIPCRKELPYFEQLQEKYRDEPLKVLLVSLDFPNNLESRLVPYLQKYNITAEVILLDDPDSNRWINKVSAEWSGAIPATIIYNTDKRTFYEKEFTYNELEQIVTSNFLNYEKSNN